MDHECIRSQQFEIIGDLGLFGFDDTSVKEISGVRVVPILIFSSKVRRVDVPRDRGDLVHCVLIYIK